MQRKVVGALFVALALVVAACGSSGPKPASPRAFRAQANAVCRQTHAQLMQLESQARGTLTPAVARRAVAIMDGGLRKLGRAQPPAEAAAQFSQLTRLLRNERDYVALAQRQRQATGVQASANMRLIHRIGPVARSLGLPDCT